MIICLYGPDSYRRNNKLRDLVREYRGKYADADMASIDLEEGPDNWLKIKEFLNQPSIFTDSKVAVIKESGLPEGKEWPKILKSHLETKKTFLLISDKDKPKKTFQFLLEKPSQVQPFLELENGTLEFFAKREAEQRGLDLSPEAWRFFISYLNSRTEKSWAVVNELQKISLAGFNPPAGKPLSVSDLRSVIDWFAGDNVFSLAKELLRPGNTLKKIGFLERLFLQKEEPARLFNLLAYQSWGENAARLADYDVSIKSGGLGYEEALLAFALIRNA
ncbi:MAG: hypothetical protein AAB935_02210 [Patescibacteria group bacterium]